MPTEFLRKSFKIVCIDSVLFFAMFVLVGHISINYWERYTIQNELYSMKHSLHTLKDNVGNIGKAYDNLHTELRDLFFKVDEKQIHHKDTPECWHKEKLEATCKTENKLNKNRRDFEVQTVLTTNKMKIGGVDMDNNKNRHAQKNKATGRSVINASTNTKNAPKSTGTSSDISNEEDHLHCQKDFENCKRNANDI